MVLTGLGVLRGTSSPRGVATEYAGGMVGDVDGETEDREGGVVEVGGVYGGGGLFGTSRMTKPGNCSCRRCNSSRRAIWNSFLINAQ